MGVSHRANVRNLSGQRLHLLPDPLIGPVGDAIGHIVSLENLMLGVPGMQKISNESLKHIQGLTNLRRLTLKLTDVTEEGLAQLAPLQSLKKLQLKRDMCKTVEAKELKKKIPGLSIRDNA